MCIRDSNHSAPTREGDQRAREGTPKGGKLRKAGWVERRSSTSAKRASLRGEVGDCRKCHST
eukprot:12082796-Prorocentrum_lima.AAC.1